MGQQNEICKNAYSVVLTRMVAVIVLCDSELLPFRGLSLGLVA